MTDRSPRAVVAGAVITAIMLIALTVRPTTGEEALPELVALALP